MQVAIRLRTPGSATKSRVAEAPAHQPPAAGSRFSRSYSIVASSPAPAAAADDPRPRAVAGAAA